MSEEKDTETTVCGVKRKNAESDPVLHKIQRQENEGTINIHIPRCQISILPPLQMVYREWRMRLVVVCDYTAT